MPDPRRGEVWIVDLGLAAKVRPCLVLGVPARDEDRALVRLVPHTTSTRDTRFEAHLKVAFLRPGAFDEPNLVTIAHSKLVRRLGSLSGANLAIVEKTVRDWLGLKSPTFRSHRRTVAQRTYE